MISPQGGAAYWLGVRNEDVVTDFDGRLRACQVLGRVERPPSDREPAGRRYLLLRVDPPLRMAPPMPPLPGGEAELIVVAERDDGTNLDELDRGWLSVLVFTAQNPDAVVAGDLEGAGLSMVIWGEIARQRSELPRSQEESFEYALGLLLRFADRAGHVDVPDDHREDGIRLSIWVNNMRSSQAHGHLRTDWGEQLEAVPGWTWRSGDDVALMDHFARREGHTDVPIDHREEGHPLGLWTQEMRKSYAMGSMHPDQVQRIEAIPHWHW